MSIISSAALMYYWQRIFTGIGMNKDERQQLQTVVTEVNDWVKQARQMLDHRATIEHAATEALSTFAWSVVAVRRVGRMAWYVLPLGPDDDARIRSIAMRNHLPGMSSNEEQNLTQLTSVVAQMADLSQTLLGVRRLFASTSKKQAAAKAAAYLAEYQAWGHRTGLPQLIDRLAPSQAVRTETVADVLSDDLGITSYFSSRGTPVLTDVGPAQGLSQAIAAIEGAVKNENAFKRAAVLAGNEVRLDEARQLLASMPVDKLKEATGNRLRIRPLLDAGITTVQTVLSSQHLEYLPGVSITSATQIRAAAQRLQHMTYEETPLRIDVSHRTAQTTAFLSRLGEWEAMRCVTKTDLDRVEELRDLAMAVTRRHTCLLIFQPGSDDVQQLFSDTSAIIARAAQISERSSASTRDPWEDFIHRPADYLGMVSELGFATEGEKTHGDLPEDLIGSIQAVRLDTDNLTVSSLRGYQDFAARFALTQRKVIIGDEMGLGKTVEALAVLAHLSSQGCRHMLVVCPAAIVTNWMREISSKSRLRPHLVYGPARYQSAQEWVDDGGVAVTTYETLGWFLPVLNTAVRISCVVIDEAHYIKNPGAKRSINSSTLITRADMAMLLTGTPLENRITEFATLVRYVQPKLVVDTSGLSPRRFRQQVAPAYLRRNQEDVLTELPELVEVDEVVPMSSADQRAYRDTVADGNFMAMRQAAMLQGKQSEKVQRLLDIVAEAEDNGRRVIVYSYFREVLSRVAHELPGQVFGPITGSVAPIQRQQMIDEFSTANHAVLVSQIVAGGIGLNIQAASVVVICEPQLKPTTEWQAIARARRMGQLESVQVHRLLSDEGVDQRLTELLAHKSALFDEYARVSATADSTPEALDITEAQLAREVIAAERERLFPGAVTSEALPSTTPQ